MQIEYCISLIRSIYKFFFSVKYLTSWGKRRKLYEYMWSIDNLETQCGRVGWSWKGVFFEREKLNHIFRTFRSWISICCHVWIRVLYLSLFLFVCLSLCLSVYLRPSVCISLSLCLSVCLSLSVICKYSRKNESTNSHFAMYFFTPELKRNH